MGFLAGGLNANPVDSLWSGQLVKALTAASTEVSMTN